MKAVKKLYLHGLHQTDKEGSAIFIKSFCNIDEKRLFEVVTPERLLLHHYFMYDRLIDVIFPACTEAKGKYISTIIVIIDMKDAIGKLMMSSKLMEYLKATIECAQNNYPEIVKKIYIINAGIMFTVLWNIIKVFVNKKTEEKIKVLGNDYKEKLLDVIDSENLPKELGGTCEECESKGGCFNVDPGPWDKYIKQLEQQYKQQKEALNNSKRKNNLI